MKIPKSKRSRRIGVEIQKILAEALRNEMTMLFPGVVVSIPEVRVSDDLSIAEVYTSIYGIEDPRPVHSRILKRTGALRREVSRMRIRKIPELRFVWDDTMERADRIEQLLNSIRSSSSPPNEDDRAVR
jgi:ribosome-binding factor A